MAAACVRSVQPFALQTGQVHTPAGCARALAIGTKWPRGRPALSKRHAHPGGDAAAVLELNRFSENHLVDDVEKPNQDIGHVRSTHSAQGIDQQPVAGENRCCVSIEASRGRRSSTTSGELYEWV